MKGSACYSKVRKELTILSWKTGTTFDVFTYSGVDFDKYPSPYAALTATGVALVASTVLLQQVLSGSQESTCKVNPVVTNDGTVFVTGMNVSSKFWVDKFTRNGVTQITSANQASQTLSSTCYGLETGIAYGQRQISSRDGQAIACFCPYYYYGSGLIGYFIDKTNNTYTPLNSIADTGISYKMLPFKDSGFAVYQEGNVYPGNPTGHYFFTYERQDASGASPSAIRMTAYNRMLPYFPNSGNTTNYPALLQVVDYSMMIRDVNGELIQPYGDSM
jgi:hypothetical protein